jgi:hypothetical protein
MTNPTVRLITWDEFETEFKPRQNLLTKRSDYNGWKYETYGDHEAFIRMFAQTNPENVWTIMDGDEGIIIGSGWHYVNRMGYIITELPYKAGQSVTVQDEKDIVYDLDFEAIGKKFTKKQLDLVLREGGFRNDFKSKEDIAEFLVEVNIQTIKSDEEAVRYIKALLSE